jgi:hypothetical protein
MANVAQAMTKGTTGSRKSAPTPAATRAASRSSKPVQSGSERGEPCHPAPANAMLKFAKVATDSQPSQSPKGTRHQ